MTKRFTGRAAPLLAIGTIAAGAFALSRYQSGPDENTMYTSIDQCIEAGFNSAVCHTEYQNALDQHQRTAPRFDTQPTCETSFGAGQCLEVPRQQIGETGSGSVFIPLMTGYLLSSALYQSSGSSYSGGSGGSWSRRSTPIYRDRSGATVRSDPVIGTEKALPRPANVNTRAVSRGGFGGLSSGRGGSFGG